MATTAYYENITGKEEAMPQAQQKMTPKSLVTWQEHDHLRNLIKQTLAARDLSEKQRLFNQLVKDMSQHEVAEEVVRPFNSAFSVRANFAVFR